MTDWTDTRLALHYATQVLGGIRKAFVAPDPQTHLHLSLVASPTGLTTGPLPQIDELILDFARCSVIAGSSVIPITGETQASLLAKINAALGTDFEPELHHADVTLKPDAKEAAAYLQTLTMMTALLERLYEEVPGKKTPVVVWPHGFDTSFMWFDEYEPDENNPHAAFGFSPWSPGIEKSYLYGYVYPLPPNLTDNPLPSAARWNTEHGWTGALISEEQYQDSSSGTLFEALQAIANLFASYV